MENSAWVEENGSGFDFKYYGRRYLKLWPLLTIGLVICLSYTYYYVSYELKPLYKSLAKVRLSNENYAGGTASMGFLSESGTKMATEEEIFRSSYLMQQLVIKKRLNIFWYLKGRLKEEEIFNAPMQLFVDKPADSMKSVSFTVVPLSNEAFELEYLEGEEEIVRQIRFGDSFSLPRGDHYVLTPKESLSAGLKYKIAINSVWATAGQFGNNFSALVPKGTSTMQLFINSPVPEKGAYILNQLIEEYIYQDSRDKGRIADSTIKFIDNRILKVNEELTELEGTIQGYMQERGLANLQAQSGMLLSNQNVYTQQLISLENRLSLIKELKSNLSSGQVQRFVPGVLLEEDGGFANLSHQYNDLLLQRERSLLAYKPDHPNILNIDKQLEEVRQNILEYLNNTENRLIVNRRDIQATVNRLAGDVRQVPKERSELLNMERRQQLAQEMYLFLLQRREEVAVANSARGTSIRIIEPARGGANISKKPDSFWTMAFIIAFLIPAGKIAAEELLNNKVRTRKDITKRTTAPVIAEISHKEEDYTLIDFAGKRSALAEQFRSLRTDLAFMLTAEGAKVVMLTSGMPGEGKSFTALNLAHILAYAGKKVLLMEFDLRRPKLSEHFNQRKQQQGITNYIVDRSLNLAQLAYPVPHMDGLDYIGSGPVPPNPSELIVNDRTRQLMEEAKANYDMVVIDTPPIGLVTDAQLLNHYADATLYMVRANHSPLDLLKLIDELYQSGKLRNMALVFNDVKQEDGGYYGYYGYGYGYYGETEKKRKKSWFKKNQG